MPTSLVLVPDPTIKVTPAEISLTDQLRDHNAIIDGYLDTFKTRNFSQSTMRGEARFIKGWFEGTAVTDLSHPDGERQLFIWEAMVPVTGRQRIIDFSKGLCVLELKAITRRSYLGILRRLFAYVLEWPYIPGSLEPIYKKYGPLDQPVLEYDYPAHSVDIDDVGFPPTGDDLLDFYNFIRTDYTSTTQKKLTAARDYAMIVLTGESGLRSVEIRHLDALGKHRDLFYEKGFIQTRYGKGTNGSGPRVRKTIFTELAQATMYPYEEKVRPKFLKAATNPALFLSSYGNRISYDSMAHALSRIVKEAVKAGLRLSPDITWHTLRKAFAANYIEQYPERIWRLMEYLGHINPSTLHRYIKHSRAYEGRIVTRVANAILPKHLHIMSGGA